MFRVSVIRTRRVPVPHLVDSVFNPFITELLLCEAHWVRALCGTPARGEESSSEYLL